MSDAILGTFVNIKTMSDGTPRITLDMQCSLAEVAAMGLVPGVPFGLARLTKEASNKPTVEPVLQPKEKVGPLCVMACTFCADPLFHQWVRNDTSWQCNNENDAKQFILDVCEIASRKELDTNIVAAKVFHDEIRTYFLDWKENK